MAKDVKGGSRIAPELASRLREQPLDPIGVIIEADVPSAMATHGARTRAAPIEVTPLSPQEDSERSQRVERLSSFLEEILGKAPHFLKYANAFQANVTSDQLERIAESPLVRCVRENRRLSR